MTKWKRKALGVLIIEAILGLFFFIVTFNNTGDFATSPYFWHVDLVIHIFILIIVPGIIYGISLIIE